MQAVRLTCSDPAASADILPGRGGSCSAATLVRDGVPRQVIWAPPGYEADPTLSFMGGIPILCPFAGRLLAETFEFRGRTYRIPVRHGCLVPIHGLVHDRQWRVIDRAADHLTIEFELVRDAADLRGAWPADFRLTATWSLMPAALTLGLMLEARGPMPAALGLHPYLPLPIVPGGDPRGCVVELPARAWQSLQPDGRRGPLQPASARLAFPGGVPIGDKESDDVFVDLASTAGRVCTRLLDPAGATITISFDDVFTACVLYTPPHRKAVCIEPWTVAPGGVPGATSQGWRVLEAGQALTAGMTISLE